MFQRILRISLSPVVQVPHHRSRVLRSVSELFFSVKGPRTNLQPFLPKIRELILAERQASFNETGKLLAIASRYFQKDNAVQAAVRSLVVTLARRNKKVYTSQNNVCRFISNFGQLQDDTPVSTCDYFSTLLMDRSHMTMEPRHETQKFMVSSHWACVLSTFARASYDPASPVITYIVKEIVEKLIQPGGFSYSSSAAYTIAQCVEVYPSPLFIDAVRKVVTPHVIRAKTYSLMEKLFDIGCLTAEDVRAAGIYNLSNLKYSSPLLTKMILKDVEFTAVWILCNSWRSANVSKKFKKTMATCVSLVLATEPRAMTLLGGLTSIRALGPTRDFSKNCRISEYCKALLGELAGRPFNVCSREEVLRVSLLLRRENRNLALRDPERRIFKERICVPLIRSYLVQGDFSEMTAMNLVRMFPLVQAYPKTFGIFELRLVFNRLWELQTKENFFSRSVKLTLTVWRAVVRTGLRRTPFFDAFLSWSVVPPKYNYDHGAYHGQLAGALAIVAMPHKHGAYRSVEMATMRTLFRRVLPQKLSAYELQLVLVAAAQVGLRDTVLLEALARRALILVPTMINAELVASVVWALCRLRFALPALLKALVIRLHAIEGGVTSHGRHVVASLKSLT